MDSYAKVGRGGAGNYYSQQEVQEAAARLKDLEAQPTQGNTTSQIDSKASRPDFSLAGRGGAGNFVPTATASTTGVTGDLSTSLKEGTVFSGRGGAGNFRGEAGKKSSDAQTQSSESQDRAYKETVRDVEQSMKAPEKAHLGNEKIGEL